jgi:hypothetical protein
MDNSRAEKVKNINRWGLVAYLNRYFKGEEKQIVTTMFPRHIITGLDYYYLRYGYGSWLRHKDREYFEFLEKQWTGVKFKTLIKKMEKEKQDKRIEQNNKIRY